MLGHFYTFEGVDGVGKTSLIQALKENLQNRGTSVFVTKEPFHPHYRELILNRSDLSDMERMMLVCADRYKHVREVILPALLQYEVVLCDRFIHSTFAYQGHSFSDKEGLITLLKEMCAVNGVDILPDRAFLITAPPEVIRQRLKERGEAPDAVERLHTEDVALASLAAGFLSAAAVLGTALELPVSMIDNSGQLSVAQAKILNKIQGDLQSV